MDELKMEPEAQTGTPSPAIDAPHESTPSPEVKPQKFCKHCGEKIDIECIICPKCGKQVEELKQEAVQPQVVINNSNSSNNTNTNTNQNYNRGGMDYPYKSKIVAALLCFFLGVLGVHRFYVGKIGTGLLYLCSGGFCGIGALIDFIVILIGGFRDKAGMPLK